jgi:hypothetical protein
MGPKEDWKLKKQKGKRIPESFIHWAYHERGQLIRRQATGEDVPSHEIFLGFTRHNPAVVSYGPKGLNASVKGVGYLPKPQYLQETLDAYMKHIQRGWRDEYFREGLRLLMRLIYGKGCKERIDFTRFGSLELALGHTWKNLQSNPVVTLLFYQPPEISYEIRGRAEIHEEGSVYHRLINAQHDVYHQPHVESWVHRPAYLFVIEEIYDNSATEEGFGNRVY